MISTHSQLLMCLLLSTSLNLSAAEFAKIKTPRGSDVAVLIQLPELQPNEVPAATVIVAPGQSCNSKSPLFETFSQALLIHNIALVRFEWSYCVTDPTKPVPSAEFKNETEDFQTVLDHALENQIIKKEKIFFAGKSFGSLVAFASHKKSGSLSKGLILLTPLCSYNSDEQGAPLGYPISIADKYYPGLKDSTKPVIVALGSQDDLCSVPLLYNFLQDSKGNISVTVGSGDHGFRVKDSTGLTDIIKTQKNIDAISNLIGSWIFTNQ